MKFAEILQFSLKLITKDEIGTETYYEAVQSEAVKAKEIPNESSKHKGTYDAGSKIKNEINEKKKK